MVSAEKHFKSPSFSKRIIVIVGGYGSGKSEVSVNLARFLATTENKSVAIADLDIVNPYFRSREASALLEKFGIDSIHPKDSFTHADLPIILPRIKSAIQGYEGTLILDVGGDDAGSRVLSSLTDAFPAGDYEMLLVINANRPFTNDLNGCKKMMQSIEDTSRLKFTGIISNTHLVEHTDEEAIFSGYKLTSEVCDNTGLKFSFISVEEKLLCNIDSSKINVPVLSLDRLLLKPWERGSSSENI